jgi:hypothetical protein
VIYYHLYYILASLLHTIIFTTYYLLYYILSSLLHTIIFTTYYNLCYILSSSLHTSIFTTYYHLYHHLYYHPTQSSIPILNTDIHLHTQPTQLLHGMVECPRTPPSLLKRPSHATFNPCQPQKLSYTCLTYHESTSKDDIRWHIEQVKWHTYHELIQNVNDPPLHPYPTH